MREGGGGGGRMFGVSKDQWWDLRYFHRTFASILASSMTGIIST